MSIEGPYYGSKLNSTPYYEAKKVGDRVKVYDGSANKDKNTGEERDGVDPLFWNEAIVIEAGLSMPYADGIYKATMDILLKFPDGEEIYTCSNMCSKNY